MFERKLNSEFIKKFKDSDLFEKIKDKLISGELFLAIRDGYINIYNKGQSIYKIDENMNIETHYKYLFNNDIDGKVYIKTKEDKKYNFDTENLKKFFYFDPVENFEKIYKNTENYAGDEKKFVANIIKNNKDVILDVEIALTNESNTADRIDFLYYDEKTNQLQFVEVKRFSDTRLQKVDDISKQLIKYHNNISDDNNEIILNAYKNYIKNYKEFFPEKFKQIDEHKLTLNNSVYLFIVDYNIHDRNNKLNNKIAEINKKIEESQKPEIKFLCQTSGVINSATKLNFSNIKKA